MAALAATTATAPSAALAQAAAEQQPQAEEQLVEEVLVTGSRIERTTFNAPSPMRVMDREEIQKSGFQSMDDLIRDLTINSGSNLLGGIADAGPAGRGRSPFNLRGLREEATLVLLNGQRMPLNLDNFVDTNFIPMSSIGRIEIVKESGSAIYGSDAVAGVVNFITRDVEGFEFEVDYQSATEEFQQEDITFSAAFGAHGERGGINAFVEVFDRDQMFTIERDFFQDFVAQGETFDVTKRPTFMALGGPLAGQFLTTPNCEAALGTPTGPPAPGQPDGTFLGFCGGSDEIAADNMEREGPASQIVPKQKRQLIHVDGEYRFPEVAEQLNLRGFRVNAEFNWGHTENRTVVDDIPVIFSVAGPGFPEDKDLTIPAELIDPQTGEDVNPFDFPVAPFGDLLHTRFPVERDVYQWRFVGSATAEFSALGYDDWELSFEGAYGRDTRDEVFPSLSITSLDRALQGRGGFDRNMAFNPFAVDPVAANSPELIDDMLNTGPRTDEARMKVIQTDLSGTVFDLGDLYAGGGEVQVAVGAETREDGLRENDGFGSDTGDLVLLGGDLSFPEIGIVGGSAGNRIKDFIERDLWAVYGETSLPLHETLDFSAAVRFTEYDDDEPIGQGEGGIGDTINPHFSANVRPLALFNEAWSDKLRLRGTFGTGFRAPSVDKSNPGESGEAGVEDVVNPFENEDGQFVDNCQGTNVETLGRFDQNALSGPERSENWTVGAVMNHAGLQASVDFQFIRINDVIGSRSPQDVLNSACQAVDGDIQQLIDNPQLAEDLGVVVAGDAGVVRIAEQFRNEARVEQEVLDWSVAYTLPWAQFGEVSLSSNGSWISRMVLTGENGRPLDLEGNTNEGTIFPDIPDLRMNFGVDWAYNRHSANATVRVIDRFTDQRFGDTPEQDVIGQTIGSHAELDVQYSYEFPTSSLIGFGQNTQLTAGAINLLDNSPPAAPNEPRNFVREIHDARGRLVYLRFAQQF